MAEVSPTEYHRNSGASREAFLRTTMMTKVSKLNRMEVDLLLLPHVSDGIGQ